jgi:hypothetical protein
MIEILNKIFTFIFIFSCIYSLSVIFEFFGATFSNPPKSIEYSDKKKLYIGMVISYILTYLIFI